MAVCRKTLGIYTSEPYADSIQPVLPLTEIASEDAALFDCTRDTVRRPDETKLGVVRDDVAPGTSSCDPNEECC